MAVIYPEPDHNIQHHIVQDYCSHLNDFNYPTELMNDETEITLRFIHVDLSTLSELIPEGVTIVKIFTQHAYISQDIVIRDYELKVYYRTTGA